jgi:hypothetical protein
VEHELGDVQVGSIQVDGVEIVFDKVSQRQARRPERKDQRWQDRLPAKSIELRCYFKKQTPDSSQFTANSFDCPTEVLFVGGHRPCPSARENRRTFFVSFQPRLESIRAVHLD